ncbi:GGDEF domain-containing protein [Alteriqipengyuania sp. 357]
MIGALLASPFAIIMGALNGLLVAGLAHYAIGGSAFLLIIIAEVAILIIRLESLRRIRRARKRGLTPSVDGPATLSILWCLLQGSLFYLGMKSGEPVIMVIVTAHCMGLVGPISARNYPAPRLALLLVVLCIAPLVAGAIALGEPLLFALLALTPGFLLGAIQLILNYRRAMVAALSAEMANDERAKHDPLTGLLNRNGLEAVLKNRQADRPLCLVCFDLDEFKPINDRFGHAAGDRLLCEVAHRMAQVMPEEQALARVGGDEFFAVLEDHGPEATEAVIGKVISCVSDKPYVAEGTRLVEIGISAGFACYPEDSTSIDELQLLADRALYAAKNAGKGVSARHNPREAA